MAQGEFTKEECKSVREAVDDLMKKAVPKSRLPEYLGHFNDIFLFLSAAEKKAPNEAKGK